MRIIEFEKTIEMIVEKLIGHRAVAFHQKDYELENVILRIRVSLDNGPFNFRMCYYRIDISIDMVVMKFMQEYTQYMLELIKNEL